MERQKSRDDVAVFIDFENVYVSVREKFDATPNFELIMDRCEDYGRIVLARAYADWYRYPRVTSALFANGVEPMYVPTYYYDRDIGRTGRPIKNSVDIHLCIDAMRTLYTQTHIDKFVLVTGDRDFIPLVNAIRQNGKDVIIIGIGGAASAHLAQSGDEFLFYEQIADLQSPQQQRQDQLPSRSDKRDRPEPKADRGGRERSTERDVPETNGKVDRRGERDRTDREKAAPPVPELVPLTPAPQAEAPAVERSFYDTLVDAINLARQRGFVSNLGSLKVLMRELDSSFNESKVKDSNGRPFTKFKDFVKEAERLGKVQIFTNGTVTEIFLPGENPMVVSQFAEELASQQVERELEQELEAEEASQQTENVPEQAAPETDAEVEPVVEQPTLPGLPEPVVADASESAAEAPIADSEADDQPAKRVFGDREMMIFRGSMSQFNDPVRFAEIFSALRGLRNQEVFDLTNNELKDLVKQAINNGMLQRTGRGARAYYRLSSQYRIVQDDARLVQPTVADEPASSMAEAQVESAAGLVSDEGMAPAVRRRRGRAYEALTHDTEGVIEEAPAAADQVAASVESSAAQISDVVADEMAVQTAIDPAPAKPRRNRRKKPAASSEVQTPTVSEPVPEPEPQPDPVEAESEQPKAGNGSKKRRSRRKKPTADAQTDAVDAAEPTE